MANERIETGKMPQIDIAECLGDLSVRSWLDAGVMLKGDYEVTETDTGLTLRSVGDLTVMVPAASSLSVGHAAGDAMIKNVEGAIGVRDVSGDLMLVGVGAVKLTAVHGDLSARELGGTLTVETVHGDMAVRNVEGNVAVGHVYGDAAIRNITGDVDLNEVMGDVSLKTINGDVALKDGYRDVNLRNLGGRTAVGSTRGDIRLVGGLSAAEHVLNAHGDIVLRWPLNAPLTLVATAHRIENRLPLQDVVEEEGRLTGRLEDGKTHLTLTAGGRISLKDVDMVDAKWRVGDEPDMSMEFDFDVDLGDLGERISSQINEQFARVTQDIETRFGGDYAQRMAEKVARRAEKAAQRAERAATQARSRVPNAPPPPPPPPAPQPSKKRVAPEEQLKILKMVEQGKITPEEADILLKALEE